MRLFTIVCLLCLAVMTADAQTHYQIQFDESYSTSNVKVCFDGEVPDKLYNGAWRRNRWLEHATGPNGQALRVNGNEMSLTGIKTGQCIDYEVSLDAGKGRRRSLYRSGSDVILTNKMWLWQPRIVGKQNPVTLEFKLAKGFGVSAPWDDGGKPNRFVLSSTPHYWDSRIAIGKFKVEQVAVAGQKLRVAVLNSAEKRKREYIGWIKQAATAVASVTGQYPVNNPQIVIVPIGAKREAVPWGEVQRGGKVAAHFFVDSFRPIQEFKDDWTAAHELSHMFVPFIDRDELYLSEGIASYYQNVARAKTGMLSKEAAWDKLLAGFGRGSRSAKRELLANNPSTMQMYWGGAAIYLMADAELRARSNGRQTLGTVLHKFNQCCRPSNSSWTGKRLMAKFDELSQSKIFTTLYYEQAQARRFPDVQPLLRELGFNGLKRDRRKSLSSQARQIME